MEALFKVILEMSVTGGIAALLVILARAFLRKTPKVFSYALWAVVLFRLVCPFSFESMFSLFSLAPPQATISIESPMTIEPSVPRSPAIIVQNEQTASDAGSAPITTPPIAPVKAPSVMLILSVIWLCGILALLLYSVFSYIKLRRSLKEVTLIEGNIYEAKGLKTPFVFGLVRPKIYLPKEICEEEKSYILRHEQVHISRRDYLVKPLSFLVLCVHWFNPLAWVSFILMTRDMEMSCDERVLKEHGAEIKRAYSTSLLSAATSGHLPETVLAFGEGSVKTRVKNILSYKKTKLWVGVVAAVAVIAIGISIIANPLTRLSATPDFSEVTSMSYGSEWPSLLYADENYAVIDAVFCALVFDFKSEKITDKVSLEQGRKWGISAAYFSASEDGKRILVTQNPAISSKPEFYYSYNIADNSYKKVNLKDNVFDEKLAKISTSDVDSDPEFSPLVDSEYPNFGGGQKISEESFVYLRNDKTAPGSAAALQLVKYSYADKTSKVFDIFADVNAYKKEPMPAKLSDFVIASVNALLASGERVHLDLVMTEGEYYTEEFAGAGGGTYPENYSGKYEIRVSDDIGNLLTKTKLTDKNGTESYNFAGQFWISLKDYNDDGNPDFSIGQWAGSTMNEYTIYSIYDGGEIKLLGNILSSEKNLGNDFSAQFSNVDDTTIETYVYYNGVGATRRVFYRFDAEAGEFLQINSEVAAEQYGFTAQDISIVTDDTDRIGCEFGRVRNNKLDTLEMLGELEKLNGFGFETAWASHGYVKLVFPMRKPESVFLRYCSDVDDAWQQEYPIDSANYKIKVPTKPGSYSFFADIKWNESDTETIYFNITVYEDIKDYAPLDLVSDDPDFISCSYMRVKLDKFDTIEMLGELDRLDGFVFDTAWAKDGYVKFVFPLEKPENISMEMIGEKNGVTQSEYKIDGETYKIKVPTEVGRYRFLATLNWEEGAREVVCFSITVKEKV